MQNRNLHSPTKLTEFARSFDEEPETLFTKFVNKLTTVYNTGYNTVNEVPTNSSGVYVQSGTLDIKKDEPNQSTSSDVSPKIATPELPDPLSRNVNPSRSGSTSTESSIGKEDGISALPEERTPTNVLRRISNLVASKNNNLSNYKDTELHKFWMPDSKSKECYDCSQKFSTFRRKHHCRLCGQIFCSKCCNQVVPGRIIFCSGDLKVCTYCSKVVLTYLKSSDITSDLKSDLQALQNDLSSKLFNEPNHSQSEASGSQLRRDASLGYQEERFGYNPTSAGLSNADRKNILQQSNSLKLLYEEMLLNLITQNRGSDLIHYLIANQKSSNKIQAVAILNALIEAGFMTPIMNVGVEDIEIATKEFSEETFYKFLRRDDVMSSSGSFQLGLDLESSSVHLSRPSVDKGSVPQDIFPPNAQDNNHIFNPTKDFELQNYLLSTAGSKPLLEAFCEHEELLLSQLLRNQNLDQSWMKTLIPLCARIANTIRPELCGTDLMDIRNYVNFKKIPGGTRNDCKIVGGVVFSKNVVHKEMASRIENPKILLLKCAIVYQRVEGKFVSIDTLLLQEKEYLRNVIARILSLQPNVVLVHKNVSGVAQDMLRSHGITLVLDVKLTVLERLSRCLKCDIVTSIDSNIGRPKLGVCDLFYIRSFDDGFGIFKTLMFFEKPSNPRGSCGLIRGGTHAELGRVKNVARLLLFARYNWRLELSFLLDEFARPPSPKPSIFDSKEQSPCENHEELHGNESSSDDLQEDQRTDRRPEKMTKTKLEEKFLNKENVQDFSDPLRAADLSPSVFEPETSVEFAVQTPYDNRFRTALSSTSLSVSPFVAFPLPYLETEQGRKCFLRSHFPNELYYSKQWSPNVERFISQENVPVIEDNVKMKPVHEFVTHKITTPIDNRDLQTLLASFRASGGRLPKTKTMKKLKRKNDIQSQSPQKCIDDYVYKDALDFENHQRLPVLFCSYNYNPKAASSFCAHPSMLNMEFYGQNDIMLGQFLERYCFKSSYICPACNLPMLDHVRRYVHSMGCVQVKLTEDTQKMDSNSLLMTSWCSVCSEVTPSVAMSKDAWCLSFAKYLELRFHGHSYKRRFVDICEKGDSSQSIQNQQKHIDDQATCNHSLHRDHVQYFSYNGIVASFMYSPIEVWEICLPPLVLQLMDHKPYNTEKALEDIKTFPIKGYEVYARIYEKLAIMANDSEFQMLGSLKQILNRDQVVFRQKVEVVQTLIADNCTKSYDINDAFLIMKRTLAENIELWGPRLHEANIQSKTTFAAKMDAQVAVDAVQLCNEDGTKQDVDSDVRSDTDGADDDKEVVERSEKPHEVEFQGKHETTPDRTSKDIADKNKMKALLSQFRNSSSNTNALHSPLSPNEHYTLPLGCFPVLVHDQDLSSVIAYSLTSNDYKKALDTTGYTSDANCSPSVKRKSQDGLDTDEKDQPSKPEQQDKKGNIKHSSHIEIYFQDLTTQFTCKIYFAHEFDNLRANFLNSPKPERSKDTDVDDKRSSIQRASELDKKLKKDVELDRKSSSSSLSGKTSDGKDAFSQETEDVRSAFARSLSRSMCWEARGGKSGSKFSKTTDDRFILKEMSKQDIAIFENFAPNYFEYVNQCLQQNNPTLLAKIFGVFKVTIKRKDSVLEKSLLVMENLFYECEIANKFDLKGSDRNRLVDPTNQSGEIVLLDENLIQMSWSKPLYVLMHSKTILKEAIMRDASFLEKNDVMDYSLLVGLNSKDNILVLGIIDYIRTFTLDKRLESIVKQSGLLGGQGKLPTVISPKPYKQRFSEAMERYFLTVPDRWEGLAKM